MKELSALQEAKEFLDFLTAGAPANTLLAVTELLPSRKMLYRFYGAKQTENAAKDFVTNSAKNTSNMYIRCSLLGRKPERGRGKKEDTAGATTLWVDIDPERNETVEKIVERLQKLETPPSWIVQSGKGVHAYWKLDGFITDNTAIESRNKALGEKLRADHCWDVSHVLRVPGAHNYKDIDNPLQVKTLYKSERVYSLNDFPEARLPQVAIDSAMEPEELAEDFLAGLPKTLADRIVNGSETDRSKNDWYVCKLLIELGKTPEQCFAVMLHPTWAVGEKTRERGVNYAIRTIQDCMEKEEKKNKTSNQRLLEPVIKKLLFYTDERGAIKKNKILRGGEFVRPVTEYLLDHGVRFYVDKDSNIGYIVTSEGRVHIAEAKSQTFRDWLTQISDFTEEEHEHKILRAGLATQARESGDPVKLTHWCYLDSFDWTFYLLLDTQGRTVLKVPVNEEPSVVLNGTDGKLMQSSEISTEPILWNMNIDIKKGLSLFVNDFSSVIASDPVSRGILTCYVLAAPLAYGSRVQVLPLLHLTGQSNGGKSQTLGMISTWLHGEHKLLNSTVAAIYRVANREVLLPFDDYEKMEDDLKQLILTAVTGITRQKSGRGVDDIINQAAQVLMALTSISELEDETVRRRAIVIEVDKERWGTDNFDTTSQWQKIANNRSAIWSAYIKWLSTRILRRLQTMDFSKLVKITEEQIPIDLFRGLAPYMTLMYIIGNELEKLFPGVLATSTTEQSDIIAEWVNALHMGDNEEVEERKLLLTAIRMTFDAMQTLPGSENDLDLYRDMGVRVRLTPFDKLPLDGDWIGIEGTMSEWMVTLQSCSKNLFRPTSEKALGHDFKRLLKLDPEFPQGGKESEPVDMFGLSFIKLKNAGARYSSRGWRIMLRRE